MLRFLIRRLLATVAVLFGVSLLIFGLVKATPGDAARAQLPATAGPDQIAQLRRALGLDRPLTVQYGIWLGNALRGDLGLSHQHRTSALEIALRRFRNTAILAAAALALAVTAGLAIGVLAGTRPNSLLDRSVTTLGVLGASLPTFWLGIMLLILFSLRLGWFPAVGMNDPRGEGGLADTLLHLVLPALTAAAVPAAVIARTVRSATLEIMGLDYVRTARAKGLAESRVVGRHAMRNAVPIFVTIVALQAGYLLGGSLVTEIVFSWPGMGLQLYTSIGARDTPVIMAVTLIVALVFTLLNLLADLLHGLADPRLRSA